VTDTSGSARRGAPWVFIAAAIVIALGAIGYLAWTRSSQQTAAADLRVSVPPFVDTAFTQVGVEKSLFGPLNPRIELVDTTWENQYDILSGGGLDVSMSTLDEFVNKSRNLAAAGKPVVFVLPAWKFRGLGFYAAKGVRPYSDFTGPDAKAQFLTQLRGKKVVVPDGSVFAQALRAFVEGSGTAYDDLQLVNASLDSAMNSLADSSVAVVAVGSQQRFEAERRGYVEAISPEALGLDVITGFVTPEAVWKTRKADVIAFACGWYKTTGLVTQDPRAAYTTTNAYLVSRGASSLTFEEYSALRAYNVLPRSPTEATSLFIAKDGGANWKKVWDRSVKAMADAGKEAETPANTEQFVAPQVISDAAASCR
jgi:hypothetical protein